MSPGNAQNSVAVPEGESITFDILPDNGYQLHEIYVDYQLQHRDNPFTINNVTAPHVLYVTFTERLSIASADESELSVYPNPASDIINLRMSNAGAADYFLYDMAGRLLVKGAMAAETPVQLDLSRFDNGVYYVAVVGDKIRVTKKIVIAR